jgi:diacylglycerol O-acyltransferase / wax synthase
MGSPRIERVSANDLMTLAPGTTGPPMQVAAILLLDRQLELTALRAELTNRIRAVPRLRQRLVHTPPGCGRPVWVDDAGFDIGRHVHSIACPTPGDEPALLEAAAAMAQDPLALDRPLWSATLVNNVTGDRSALVLVMHHVLADGIGGLAALMQLVDGPPPTAGAVSERPFPLAAPSTSQLLADAAATRLRAVRRLPIGARLVRDAFTELWTGRLTLASRCSLNQPTGPRRRIAVARADIAALKNAAAAHGATVNDALLAVVAGSLQAVLRHRGEFVDHFVMSVPISGRREASAAQLGNAVGVMPVVVPAVEDSVAALPSVARATQARRQLQGRSASTIVLAPLFRGLARIGLFQWFVDRQPLVTTFVSNVRGPESHLLMLGARIEGLVPISLVPGNVTICFSALSYAGTLTVTVVVDPDRCPDLPVVATALQDHLNRLTEPSTQVVDLEDVVDGTARAVDPLRPVPES